MYWYASRAYDPAIGRFVSPDSIVPEPGNPQSLNRYSYVYNNPLGYVDPSGNSAEWFNQAWRDEFRAVHKRDPGEGDIAYRRASMEATSRGQYWSDKYWVSSNYSAPPPPAPAPNIQNHKANLAENYNPTIVLADQAREDHLAENYNPTIRPGNPARSGPSISISTVRSTGSDDATNERLLGLARALDYADLTITGSMAAGTAVATVLAGPAGTVVLEAAYQPVSLVTLGLDVVGATAIGIADINAGRTGISVERNSVELKLGHDTLVSATTTVLGFAAREVFLGTIVDVAQINHTESRAGGAPALSHQLRIEW